MSTELATAYISLVPTMRGTQGEIAKALMPDAQAAGDNAGKESGSRFGAAFKGALGAAAIGAALVAGFTGLYKVGSIFDDVTDTIRVGTGAQGEALAGLEQVAKNVGTSVPASFDAVGSTVADLNTRLGLSGETLTTVASQYLEAGRILGEEVDINQTTAAFSAFGIEGDAVSGAMDELFRVSQATGVGMNELAASVQTNAPAVQNLGFSFEETAALAGSLDKAGLNTSQVMGGLSRSLVNLAKDGEAPADAFQRTVGELQGYIDTGNTAAAIDLAGKVFGTRGASQFVGAIQSGTLALDDLVAATGATDDTILGVAAETADFAESWVLVKNNALSAIEPISTAVFNLAGGAMGEVAKVAQDLAPAISGFLTGGLGTVGPLLSSLGSTLGPLISSALDLWQAFSPLSLIFQVLQPLLPQVGAIFGQLAQSIGGTLITVLTSLMTALQPVVTILTGTLSGILAQLLPVFAGIAAVLANSLGTALTQIAPLIGTLAVTLGTTLGTVLQAISPLLSMLAGLIGTLLQAVLPIIVPIISLVGALVPLLDPIIQLVGALLTPLIQLLTALLVPIIALIEPIVGGLSAALTFLVNILVGVIKWIVDAITWFLNLVLGSKDAQAGITAAWNAVSKVFTDVISNITSTFDTGLKNLVNFIGGLKDKVLGALATAGTWLLDVGKNIVQGLINGVSGMIDKAVKSVTDIGGAMLDGVKGFLGIHSPSRRFRDEVGEPIGQGVIEGALGMADEVNAAIQSMIEIPDASSFAPNLAGLGMPSMFAPADYAAAGGANVTQNNYFGATDDEELAMRRANRELAKELAG